MAQYFAIPVPIPFLIQRDESFFWWVRGGNEVAFEVERL